MKEHIVLGCCVYVDLIAFDFLSHCLYMCGMSVYFV